MIKKKMVLLIVALAVISAKATNVQVIHLQEGEAIKGYLEDESVPDSLVITGGMSFQDFFDLRDYCVNHTGLTVLNLYNVTAEQDQLPLAAFMPDNPLQPDGTFKESRATGLRRVILPKGLKTIGNWAFGYQRNLNRIDIPETLETIGIAAFRDCSNLSRVELPKGLNRICNWAFANCTALSEVNLPEELEYIDAEVFYNTGIGEIVVPESVRKIGYGAFACSKHLVKGTLPKSLRTIPTQLFYETPINAVVWPDHVEEIDEDAFCGSQFEELQLPDGLQKIGAYAFGNNEHLRSVEFPTSLLMVSEAVFQDCPKLTRLVCKASTPPVLDSSNSDWCSQVTLYVPQESVDAYRSASVWKDCKEIVEIGVTAIDPVYRLWGSDTRVYDLHGHILKGKPSRGIHVKHGRKYSSH